MDVKNQSTMRPAGHLLCRSEGDRRWGAAKLSPDNTLGSMKHLPRWTPVAIAIAALLGIHSWHIALLISGDVPFQSAVSIQEALLASLRDVPQTCVLLLPAWLPVLVPLKMVRSSRWVGVVCGAIALAIAVSFGLFVVLRHEWVFGVVAALYAVVGVLHLTNRPIYLASALASPKNGT